MDIFVAALDAAPCEGKKRRCKPIDSGNEPGVKKQKAAQGGFLL
jgi:hypothetical protein